ncbi:MAG TPA: hypothetical protein VGG40_08200 [Solirubrobacterales bacterium]|jgi:hypothetical protein
MRRRLALLVLVPLVLSLAACGGGSATGSSSGGGSADPFAQLRFVLGKFPYAPWYRECIVEEVEGKLSAAELEELAELPTERGRKVALRFALGAAPSCKARGRKPIVPGATHVQVQLLRVSYGSILEALGRRQGLDAKQASCLSRTVARFPDQKVIALGNATEKERERILVKVVEGCAK